jgi:hypothetical protein
LYSLNLLNYLNKELLEVASFLTSSNQRYALQFVYLHGS